MLGYSYCLKENSMPEKNKELIYRWFEEVWNQGRIEVIDQLFAEDGLAHGLAGDPLVGPTGFKALVVTLRAAFPDIHITVEDIISEGDRVAARVVVRGTHQGDYLGMKPTGKPFVMHGISFGRIADGKIAEAWNNYDFTGLKEQITE
jgi:steroid delta-isomerase-like uncharacterized protein